MSRDINPFGLRMPLELRTQVEAAAKANGRSLNSEILARLQESFESRKEGDTLQRVSELPVELQEVIKTLVDNVLARAEQHPRTEYGRQPP